MNEQTKNELIEIEKLIGEKEQEKNAILKMIYELRKRRLEIETGFKEGDVVENPNGRRGVLEFCNSFSYSWQIREFKKNGELSKRPNWVYGDHMSDYKKVEL